MQSVLALLLLASLAAEEPALPEPLPATLVEKVLSEQAAKVLCCVRTDRGSRCEGWTCLKLAPELLVPEITLVPGLKKFAPQFKYCILDSSSYPFFNEIWQPDDVLLVITELQISYHSNLVEPQMSARGSENILQYSSLRFYSVS